MSDDSDDRPDSDRLRELLTQLELSQREAARLLEIDGREFRKMCAGAPVPNIVLLALRRMIDEKKAKGVA